MNIIVISNRKGGCGKTTTATAMFSYLGSVSEKRVLLVDADSQANASYSLAAVLEQPGLYDVLTGKINVRDALQKYHGKDGMYLLSGSASLANIENGIDTVTVNLKQELNALDDIVDYIIIDTAPALGTLTVLALSAADSVVIPMAADVFNLQGLGGMYELVQAVQDPAVKIEGILLTRFKERVIINRQMREMIEETSEAIGTKVFHTKIREGVTISEAMARQVGLFDYDDKMTSNVAYDYEKFLKELGVA